MIAEGHSLFIINVILIVAGLRMTDPAGSRNCSNRLHCNAVHQNYINNK